MPFTNGNSDNVKNPELISKPKIYLYMRYAVTYSFTAGVIYSEI